MDEKKLTLNVSSAPHDRSNSTTKGIMLDVCLALLPATVFGIYNFGYKALLIVVTSIAASVLTEYLYEKLMKLPITTGDLSAVVTGLLLGLNLSANVPLWIPLLGGIFAILIVKMLFGGIGKNFMNPALAARCFLVISFAGPMTDFAVDGVTGATPLAALKAGESVDLLKMFLGTTNGTIGETSVVAILGGAVYLLVRKVISIRIPASIICTVAVFTCIYALASGRGFDTTFILAHICGGGLMLGAWFMATDYVTSPITPIGKILFGVLIGILVSIFRLFGSSTEGISYAIIIGNMIVPLIEKVTMPKPFGRGRA